MKRCLSCRAVMADDAVVCVNCGFDAVTRKRIVRKDSDPAGLEIPERESRAVKGPGPWIVLLVELVVFGAAMPLVWHKGAASGIYAGAAALGALVAYVILYIGASGEVDGYDVDEADETSGRWERNTTNQIMSLLGGAVDGDEYEGRGTTERSVITRIMLDNEHWGYAQAVFYGSMLALLVGGLAVLWPFV